MSTFRYKLNSHHQLTKRDATIIANTSNSNSKLNCKDIMAQPSISRTINDDNLESEVKTNEDTVSNAVKRSKMQIGILESALASLRLKEKRALRELESEMRKYRKSIETHHRKSGKAFMSKYNWRNLSASPKSDDVFLKKGGNSENLQSLISDRYQDRTQR